MSKSKLRRRLIKEGSFRRHTNAIMFTLTEDNNLTAKACQMNQLSTLCIYNVMYIDEKWFYRTRKNQNYHLALDDVERYGGDWRAKGFTE
jgi:hypothetical protein